MQEIPYGYCHCGCGEKTRLAPQTNTRDGWVKGVAVKYLKGHNGRLNRLSHVDYIVDPATGCWVWQLTRDYHGYGKIDGSKAHRVYYERHRGPIPEGLVIDHLCRNPSCVNPDYLEAVTQVENMRRGKRVKLTMEIADAIREADGSQREIAARFGVPNGTVSRIRNGTLWAR